MGGERTPERPPRGRMSRRPHLAIGGRRRRAFRGTRGALPRQARCRCHVLRIPIDDSFSSRPLPPQPASEPEDWEVLVAGSIYWAQSEALHRVAVAVREIDGATLTVIGDPELQSDRIDADRYEPARTGEAFQARLQQARLLVLGLSFDTDHPEVVRTATPARLPEYLASGVRVLVQHAPAGSHAARQVRRWDVAEVVDEPEVGAVIEAIESIRADASTCAQRAARARRYAVEQHGASVVTIAFMELLASLRTRNFVTAPCATHAVEVTRSRRPCIQPIQVLVNAAGLRRGRGGASPCRATSARWLPETISS